MTISVYWLIFAAFCFAMEALGITGVGFFFAGLGAVSLGLLMELGIVSEQAFVAQFAWFFGFTAIWAALLWKPIKSYRIHKQGEVFNNMVGDKCVVIKAPIVKGKKGAVKWSGTVMHAELVATSSAEAVAVDEEVVIKEVKGNTLFVDII